MQTNLIRVIGQLERKYYVQLVLGTANAEMSVQWRQFDRFKSF